MHRPRRRVLAGGYRGIILSGGPVERVRGRARRCPTSGCSSRASRSSASATACRRMGYLLGGHVVPAERREYGHAAAPAPEPRAGCFEGVEPERDGRVTVWMSHGDTVLKPPPGFTSLGRDRQLPGRGHGRPGPAALRGPVPPRGRPHAAGQDRSSRTSSTSAGVARRLVHAVLRRHGGGRDPRAGGPGPGALRALGRRGLVRGGRADPPGGGRPAHVPLRGQRPAAEGRGRGRGADLPGRVQDEPDPRGCNQAIPRPSGRRDRSRGQAQGHRRRVHRGLRGGGAQARATSRGSPRARSIPT